MNLFNSKPLSCQVFTTGIQNRNFELIKEIEDGSVKGELNFENGE